MKQSTPSTLETMVTLQCKDHTWPMKTHGLLWLVGLGSLKIFYTFYLKGVKDLPQELLGKPVEPHPSVEATPAAKALEPHATIAGFTNWSIGVFVVTLVWLNFWFFNNKFNDDGFYAGGISFLPWNVETFDY